jgi:hypothetical protein
LIGEVAMRVGWLACLIVAWACGNDAAAEPDCAPAAPAATRPATRPFTLSKETTYYTAPVRADGTIDYAEAINARLAQGVTPANNAAIPLLDAVETGNAGNVEHFARVRAKLGVPPLSLKDPGAGDPPQGEVDGLDFALENAWTADKAPAMAKWLEANGPRLDRVVEASRRPRFYLPLIREHEGDTVVAVLLPHLNPMRQLVNALKARAMLALGNEDMEGFRRDVTAILRIARLTSGGPTLVERLVAIGCEMVALDAIEKAATGGWLSATDVEKLLAEIRGPAAGASSPIWEAFEMGERVFMLEFLQIAAVRGVGEASQMLNEIGGGRGQRRADAAPAAPVDPGAKDWDAAMRKANGWYDRYVEAGRRPTYPERAQGTDRVMADVEALRQRMQGWRGVFAPLEDRMLVIVLPSVGRAYLSEARMHAERVLTETTLALSLFRGKVGEYPANLNELVPAYFKSEPLDPLTGKPLVYQVEGRGYVLRSLGANGRQDDGPKADDRVLRAER